MTDGDARSAASARSALVAILAGALLLRVFKLTAVALWYDEAVAMELVAHTWRELFNHIALDVVPPLYFCVLKIWCQVFGNSVVAVRALSVVCELLAVLSGYFFVKEASGRARVALLAALFLAVNPFHIQYARETKMYGLGLFLVLFASFLLTRAMRTGATRYWVAYGVAVAACVYTHYFLLFSAAAQAVVVLAASLRARTPGRSGTLGKPVMAYALAAGIFAPWIPILLRQMREVGEGNWIPGLTGEALLRLPWTLLLGGSDSQWAPTSWLIMGTVATLLLLVLAALRNRRWAEHLVMAQAIGPIALGLLLSTRQPVIDRYFLFASAFLSILVAFVVSDIRPVRLRRFAAAAVVFVSLAALAKNLNGVGLVSFRHPVDRPGMSGAAAFVNEHARPEDRIVVAHSMIFFGFRYYNRTPIVPLLYLTMPLDEMPLYGGRFVLHPPEVTYDLPVLSPATNGRIWYLWTDGFYQHKLPVPEQWRLIQAARFEDTPSFKGGIVVELYDPSPVSD